MRKPPQAEPGAMLIGRDRLFYRGLLGGAMRDRRLGALAIYAAPEDDFEISVDGGAWRRRSVCAVAPFVSHRLRSASGRILNVCIEPESIDRAQLDALAQAFDGGPDQARRLARLRAADREIAATRACDGFTTDEFDALTLGRALAPRAMDRRIADAVDAFRDERDDIALTADGCARAARLSTSRFLHLFKETTDIPFRSHRMWKRARRFMDHANRSECLTFVALDLGYPDSSHFSHSIRKTFGLQPRAIRDGSRSLRTAFGENYRPSCAA